MASYRLTAEQVGEARRRYALGETATDLAFEFGVTRNDLLRELYPKRLGTRRQRRSGRAPRAERRPGEGGVRD